MRETDIGSQVGVKSAVFPVVVAGDDNRAAFGFLGTTTPGDFQDDNNFKGVWHLYIATTYDAGNTWITIDATPDDPVQVGSLCVNGTSCGATDPFNPSSRNLLDFNDFTIDSEGRAVLGYADGCLAPGCTRRSGASSSSTPSPSRPSGQDPPQGPPHPGRVTPTVEARRGHATVLTAAAGRPDVSTRLGAPTRNRLARPRPRARRRDSSRSWRPKQSTEHRSGVAAPRQECLTEHAPVRHRGLPGSIPITCTAT